MTTNSNCELDKLAAASLRKGADTFRRLNEQARREGKISAANTLRSSLMRKLADVKSQIEDMYIHPTRIEGQELLKGRVPKRALERAVADGGAVFGTEHPRQHWFVTQGSLEQSQVCVSVSMSALTMNVYPLEDVKENDVCRLML